MKKCNLITEISLEDFLKLNLKAYEHRRHYHDANGNEIDSDHTGEYVKDSNGDEHWVFHKGVSSVITWDEVSLSEVVKKEVEFSKEEGFENRCICVAIHTEPTVQEVEAEYAGIKEKWPDSPVSIKDIKERKLFEYSYLDKWLTPLGYQTYLIRCDVPHLYSEKRKFCTHDDYFEIPKSETKAVYLIRY